MYGGDRARLREVFFQAWARHLQGEALEGVERLIVAVAARHPEYRAILEQPARYRDSDYLPGEQENPFLHMAMHIALEEQLALDRPTGLRDSYRRLLIRCGDEHRAQHAAIDCLREVLWQAQQSRSPPDEQALLACLQDKGAD